GGPDAARAAGGEHCLLGFENIDFAGFHFESRDANDFTLLVTQEIERHPLYKELSTGRYVALVQRVQHGVPGAVGCGTGALDGLLAEIGGMATKRTLIDRA